MQPRTTLLNTYLSGADARFDAQLLMNEGIESLVTNGFAGALLPIATGGVRLMVFEDDLQRAVEILRKAHAED